MSNAEDRRLTEDEVAATFRNLVTYKSGDIEAALIALDVEASQAELAKRKLQALVDGDSVTIQELMQDLQSPEPEFKASKKGGITKLKRLKKWGITYGLRLYVSHSIVSAAADITALGAAIAAACGPEAVPFVIGLSIAFAALRVLDRGNGIMITQIPPLLGPYIPTPQ